MSSIFEKNSGPEYHSSTTLNAIRKASPNPPQPSETVAEAMECLLALVGTPIGRRKLGIEPDDERLVTVRSALRALKGEA